MSIRTPETAAPSIVKPPGGIGEDPVYLVHPDETAADEFLATMRRSRALHHPWIQPPVTDAGFRAYLARMARDDHAGFLVRRRDNQALAGVVNVNNIVHGAFLSGSLGYYAADGQARRGYLSAGLGQVLRIAFGPLGLHRLEANIQPANGPSIALVRRLGFRREGFSPAYLFIDGGWRDHERWALVADRSTLLPPGVSSDIVRRVP